MSYTNNQNIEGFPFLYESESVNELNNAYKEGRLVSKDIRHIGENVSRKSTLETNVFGSYCFLEFPIRHGLFYSSSGRIAFYFSMPEEKQNSIRVHVSTDNIPEKKVEGLINKFREKMTSAIKKKKGFFDLVKNIGLPLVR